MTATRRVRDGFLTLVGLARGAMTKPGFELFSRLLVGWVLHRGGARSPRSTCWATRRPPPPMTPITGCALWRLCLESCWRALVVATVAKLCPDGPIDLDLDDTLHHRPGPKVEGAGVFRDAVRSTKRKVVYATGLNLVVVTLRVVPPWGGCPVGIPVGVALHRKNAETTTELGRQILADLSEWLPERSFHLTCDGAYAGPCGSGLPRTRVTSRVRRNASFDERAPARTGKRGRPRKRGCRAPNPKQYSSKLADQQFEAVELDGRGKTISRLVWSKSVLWYSVDPVNIVRLVIVRDPAHHEPDDYFVTTDMEASAGDIVARLHGAVVDRGDVQGREADRPWRRPSVLEVQMPRYRRCCRTGARGHLVLVHHDLRRLEDLARSTLVPEEDRSELPLRLAALRLVLWQERITTMSPTARLDSKMMTGVLEVLSRAA